MDDREIVTLYLHRSETAILETDRKYGAYCGSIAYHILNSREDSEECVSDTWLKTWNAIPPKKPDNLKLFVGRITRNLALDRFKAFCAQRRGGGQVPLALEELSDCVPGPGTPEASLEEKQLSEALSRFLRLQPEEARRIFVLRYWYLEPVGQIAEELNLGLSKVKSSLHRTRKKLKDYLIKEGIAL